MCIDKPIRAGDITPCNRQGKLRTSRGLTSTIHFPFIRTIVATVCVRQADSKSVIANTRINKFVAVRSLGFRSRAKQIRKFPTNAVGDGYKKHYSRFNSDKIRGSRRKLFEIFRRQPPVCLIQIGPWIHECWVFPFFHGLHYLFTVRSLVIDDASSTSMAPALEFLLTTLTLECNTRGDPLVH